MPELAESGETITRHFIEVFGLIKEEAKPETLPDAPKKGARLFDLEFKRAMTARRKAQ
jgi:hypothetical protein